MKFTEYLDQVEGRVKAATPGPWSIHVGFDRFSTNPGCYGAYLEIGNECNALVSVLSGATKELIVNSPEDLTRLVAAARKMHRALDNAAAALLKGVPICSHFQRGSAADDLHCAVIEAAEHIHKALTAVDKIGGGG